MSEPMGHKFGDRIPQTPLTVIFAGQCIVIVLITIPTEPLHLVRHLQSFRQAKTGQVPDK
jgi:hypothetical protein